MSHHHCIGLARQNNTNILLLRPLRRFTLPLALHCRAVHWDECWAGQDPCTLLLGTHTQFIRPRPLGHCCGSQFANRTRTTRSLDSSAACQSSDDNIPCLRLRPYHRTIVRPEEEGHDPASWMRRCNSTTFNDWINSAFHLLHLTGHGSGSGKIRLSHGHWTSIKVKLVRYVHLLSPGLMYAHKVYSGTK